MAKKIKKFKLYAFCFNYDHIIRNENDFINHWYYTMFNYLKHKLPEGWKYTELNYPGLIDEANFANLGEKIWKFI